ncbi:MAG: hypothetical protein KF889_01500 [Alphaproteobacteria bacterium]|nr:hypothetical protein [Alphaproteobacteria bacterium]MCW5741578.1 hypothetical protein [Alphaproteobacteria bacterium]
MAYSYTLTVLTDDGESVVELDLTPDEAMEIIGPKLAEARRAAEAAASRAGDDDAPQPTKRGRRKKADAAPRQGKRAKPRFIEKPCCGSVGARHKKDCSVGKDLDRDIAGFHASKAPTQPLTPEEYGELRTAMDDREFQSAQYALTKKLHPREVNTAVRSTSYEDYLVIR